MTVTILTRDVNLNVTGVLQNWTTLSAAVKFNTVGVWTITLPAFSDQAALLASGGGVIILRNGVTFMSGPIDTISYTRDATTNAYPGTLTVSGADDLVWVAERLIFPDPTSESSDQALEGYWQRSGVAGQLICDLVNANASQLAPLPERQVPGLVVAGSTLGSTVSTQARFTPLADELTTLALAGGGLGFRCSQVAAPNGFTPELLFEVYQPIDRSLTARFSFEMGNMRDVTYAEAAPMVTRDIVAGSGTGTGRFIVEVPNTASEALWGRRVEAFDDQRSTNDTVLLTQAGQTALANGAGQLQIAATTVESPTLRVGADDPAAGITGIGLGDSASLSPYLGVGVVDTVRQITLTADGGSTGGELVTLLVGDGSTTNLPAFERLIRAQDRRISKLERI